MERPPPNQFLRAIFSKSNNLLANCGSSNNLLILSPISSSLNAVDAESGLVFSDNLSDEFLQSHILRITHGKDEVLDRAKAKVYTTINGKTLVIKDDMVFPHRGFKGVKEVRLLHDSLFWLDDPNSTPYLVYFLDKPLIGTVLQSNTVPGSLPTSTMPSIQTWKDLSLSYKAIETNMQPVYKKLFAEFDEALHDDEEAAVSPILPNGAFRSRQNSSHRSRRMSNSSIAPAPPSRANTSQSFSSSSALQSLRIRIDLVINSAIGAFQMLPQSLLHSIGTETSLTGTDIEKLIEVHILNELYDIIFFRVIGITQTRDEEIAAAIERAKHADLTQLGTSSTPDLRARHNLAISKFRGFGEFHEPLLKSDALLSTINVLMRNSEKSSDDLIPSLVSVVLKAGVSNLCANILWIREFSFVDVDSGEYGFALSTLEAVIYHITSSANSLAKVSLRNQQFLEAIREHNENLVKELVESTPELLDIRDLQNRTPHQLADPNTLKYLLTQPCSVSNLSGLLLPNLSTFLFDDIISLVMSLEHSEVKTLLNQVDESGQSIAHKIYEHPELVEEIYLYLDWELKDKQGNSPLQVLARIYDHAMYEKLLGKVLKLLSIGRSAHSSTNTSDEDEDVDAQFILNHAKRKVNLKNHLDIKGNTLAHVVSTYATMESVFDYCEGDFNLLNDKGLTPLLIAIKFARSSILEYLLYRPEIDPLARDSRGHSAIHYAARGSVEIFNLCVRAGLDVNDRAIGSGVTPLHIASREGNIPVLKRLIELDAEEAWDWRGFRAGDIVKNDLVRSTMDDWSCRDREVRVLRGHIGEDCQVKYLIKSKSGGGVLRGVSEFLKLRQWMVTRYPTLGIPALTIGLPHPCQLHSRPARSVLLAMVERLDAFVQALLREPIVSQNPLLWEFLLSPTINESQISLTIQNEVDREREQVWMDQKALSNYESTEVFFTHARDQIITLSSTYRIFERKSRALKDGQLHLSVAYGLLSKALTPIQKTPTEVGYPEALQSMSDCLVPHEPSRLYRLIEDIVTLNAKISGLLTSLTIPLGLIETMADHRDRIARLERELTGKPRLHLNFSNLLTDSASRRRAATESELGSLHLDLNRRGRELRASETALADNLSRFYETHERQAATVLRTFVAGQVALERKRLDGMQRAMAVLRSL